MENINKRLVEVECILKKLYDEYIKKIPLAITEFGDVLSIKQTMVVLNYITMK